MRSRSLGMLLSVVGIVATAGTAVAINAGTLASGPDEKIGNAPAVLTGPFPNALNPPSPVPTATTSSSVTAAPGTQSATALPPPASVPAPAPTGAAPPPPATYGWDDEGHDDANREDAGGYGDDEHPDYHDDHEFDDD